ncbi:uncharacterized protein LY79DRAFT_275593 [Colletotrichum navitas]|uniref:Uncharacterized protein n=1 Tax=Colletotrichum navitas TaxID=681940 RepID=A0AAD8PVU9_9PEZI|nr:uncharacterized protein LY79DRAFT_275593 [Colletotrichum navitas]KAK1585136.1 hypothetical protein LY79DRAFT_275593 [Colletotrichum navitas]
MPQPKHRTARRFSQHRPRHKGNSSVMRHHAMMPTPFSPGCFSFNLAYPPYSGYPENGASSVKVRIRARPPTAAARPDGPVQKPTLKHRSDVVRMRATRCRHLHVSPPPFPFGAKTGRDRFLCHCGKPSRDLTQEKKKEKKATWQLRWAFPTTNLSGRRAGRWRDRSGEGGVRLGTSAVAMPIGSGPDAECRDWPDN